MEIERQRILHGQSVCILGFAEEWAEQECKKLREAGDGLAHWLYPGKLESMLEELRHAVCSRLLKVYDFGRERDYRETDTTKVKNGHIHVLPRSANVWLVREGFAPLALCADDVCEAAIPALDESTCLPSVASRTGTASEPLQDAGQPDAPYTASASTEAVSALAVKPSTAGTGGSEAPGWALKPRDGLKFYGYRDALYAYLEMRHKAGRPKPTAADFLEYLVMMVKDGIPGEWADWFISATRKSLTYKTDRCTKPPADISIIAKCMKRLLLGN
jgi:hypothetical protein